jgi:thiamine biosynthesis lipoprotein
MQRAMRPLLGTFIEIGTSASRSTLPEAFAAIEAVQRSLSFHDPDSELSRLNRSRGSPVPMSPLARRVLRLARAMMIASSGLFDCTLGGMLVRRGHLPCHTETAFLDCGAAEDIQIGGGEVRLRRHVLITLDGIAKGYAVDCAVHALRAAGARSGWVNAGGDVRAFGDCSLAVQRREADGSLRALGTLHDAAIATSSAGCRPDPSFPALLLRADGRGAGGGVVSVLAHHAWRADALTKVAAFAPRQIRDVALSKLGGRLVQPFPAALNAAGAAPAKARLPRPAAPRDPA